MVFPIAGGNESKGYEVENSLRLNDNDSPRLTFTPSTTTNNKVWTWSGWVKRTTIGISGDLFMGHASADHPNDNGTRISLLSGNTFRFFNDLNGQSTEANLTTSALFRDVSAWYHFVVAIDTTQATASNRVKIYLNGEQITDFSTSTYPSQNDISRIASNNTMAIGRRDHFNDAYLDGYIAEYNFIDGQQLTPTSFGEFDDNGVWIPKKYTGTYGTNGFFLEFQQTGTSQNSSGIGADTSGNDNHFAVTNLAATDITEDTCTNNFATLNPLAFGDNVGTLSEGNLKHTHNGGDSDVVSTIGISSGKFYAEFKAETVASNRPAIAVYNDYDNGATNYGSVNGSVLFLPDNRILVNNSSIGNFSSISSGDIIQVAVDNDNGAIYIGLNGTYLNSGNPTSGSSRTGSVSNFTAGSVTCFMGTRANNNAIASANFGNPAFSISSGNTDGKYGNFEYAPPSGYYALCTKRLAEFG